MENESQLRLEDFKDELSIFFKNNDKLIIYEFELEKDFGSYNIIPIVPDLDEMYDGELNDGIELLCQKYDIKASMAYWVYNK